MKSIPDHFCVLALGGNLGDTPSIFLKAISALQAAGFRVREVSTFLQTMPVGCEPGAPDFTNAALCGFWEDTPLKLLALCQKIEQDLGRPQDHPHWNSRTLDIDIISFGTRRIHSERLTIPHPLAKERDFVMIPLQEIAPQVISMLLHS